MKEKLLIWDIDGTLLDCGSAGRKAMDHTFKNMFDISNGFNGISMSGRLDSVIIEDAVRSHGIKDFSIDRFYDIYERTLKDILKDQNVKVYEGIVELLEYCAQKKNFINVISTGNCEIGAKAKLERCSLEKYFKMGGFGCSFVERNDIVKFLIDEVKKTFEVDIENDNIFVIGDTPYDIISGNSAGVRSIAVLTGGYHEDELKKYNPNYIFKNFSNIDEVIKILED